MCVFASGGAVGFCVFVGCSFSDEIYVLYINVVYMWMSRMRS